MDEVLKGGSGALFLFFYLLPGFLGSLVYDFLVEGRKRDNFERIVFALVMTLLSSIAMEAAVGISLLPVTVDKDTPPAKVIDAFVGRNLLIGSVLSIGIAVLLAFLNNARIIYKALNVLRITTKTSSVDVWADTFDRYRGFWISLRFSDGRFLVGWPQFYSQFGDPRELFLADATWWEPDGSGKLAAKDVDGAGVFVSDFSAIEAIEVLK